MNLADLKPRTVTGWRTKLEQTKYTKRDAALHKGRHLGQKAAAQKRKCPATTQSQPGNNTAAVR